MVTLSEMEKELDRLRGFIETLQRGEVNLDSESVSWLKEFVMAARLLPREVMEKIFWVDDNPRIGTVILLVRYAETKIEAMGAREAKDVPKAITLETLLDGIYGQLPIHAKW